MNGETEIWLNALEIVRVLLDLPFIDLNFSDLLITAVKYYFENFCRSLLSNVVAVASVSLFLDRFLSLNRISICSLCVL